MSEQTKKFFSVAIDGPAGAGKSTIARRVAEEFGFLYVDTGAIYRAFGYHMDMYGLSPKDVDGITRLIGDVTIDIKHVDGLQRMFLSGVDVTEEIRTPRISAIASTISALPVVRSYLLDMQRDLAKSNNVVMDGRDIGTVVLRGANVKIFLTADVEVRAQRRLDELLAKGEKVTLKMVLIDMKARDEQDTNRRHSPLRCARDGVMVNTTDMNLEESIAAISKIISEKR